MSKSNAVYWRDRKRQYDASLSKDEKRFYAKLATYYNREAARLDKEIAAYYAKYSVNGVLSYRNLLLALSDADKALLIEDIDAFARKYPEYADLVPVRESIYKLNRLEGLRQSIALQQMQMGAYEIQEATAFFQKQALRYANGAAEFLGLGSSFYRIDSDVIKAAVGNKWCDGKDFSQRIWSNRTKLGRVLQTDFVNGVIRGEDYHRLAKMIQEKFKRVSQKSAERLAFTEDTYLSNEAAMQAFLHESSVTQYQFVCTNDSHSCDLCKSLNGQAFEIKDRMPGENFPPMHPWCRCFFDVVVDSPEKVGTSRKKTENEAENLTYRDYDDIIDMKGKMSNYDVRKWYVAHDKNIPNLIDKAKPLLEQAKQAHMLRNQYKFQARELMENQEERCRLDEKYPLRDFSYYFEKYNKVCESEEEVYEVILNSSTRSNEAVNKKFGLE